MENGETWWAGSVAFPLRSRPHFKLMSSLLSLLSLRLLCGIQMDLFIEFRPEIGLEDSFVG